MNESSLWEWLRDIALPYGHYSRIESPDTAPGFPDVHYQVGEKGTGTLELKATDRALKVPFPNEEKGLHKSQLRWIRDNLKHGGIVWIIAEVPGAIYLLHGKHAKWSPAFEIHGTLQAAGRKMKRQVFSCVSESKA